MPTTQPTARTPPSVDDAFNAPSNQRALRTQHSADQIGIYRLFCSSRGGYYAHVTLHRNGKHFQRAFFEKRCGGEQAARNLAQAWRDTIIAEHPPMSMIEFCSILRPNNTSGVSGVYHCNKRDVGKNGLVTIRFYWKARIPLLDGKSRLEVGHPALRMTAFQVPEGVFTIVAMILQYCRSFAYCTEIVPDPTIETKKGLRFSPKSLIILVGLP